MSSEPHTPFYSLLINGFMFPLCQFQGNTKVGTLINALQILAKVKDFEEGDEITVKFVDRHPPKE